MTGWRRLLDNSSWAELSSYSSPQSQGAAPPPIQIVPPDARPDILLPAPPAEAGMRPFVEVIEARRSRRKLSSDPLEPGELSFLLGATQKIQKVFGGGAATFRAVPSGGARHPFETILAVTAISGIPPALYRYAPLQHGLMRIGEAPSKQDVAEACMGQSFVAEAPVVFFWTAIPARTEWRYGPASGKLIAIDAGHLCQNLYLASEAIGLGTCAIGAYDQPKSDRVARVDGEEEFVVYIAPVGRPS
jgi:SagB-type dehydrogenase family enzyme